MGTVRSLARAVMPLVLAWLLAVAALASLTFVVVDLAGHSVGRGAAGELPEPRVAGDDGASGPVPGATPAKGTPTPGGTAAPEATEGGDPAATDDPAATEGPTATDGPGGASDDPSRPSVPSSSTRGPRDGASGDGADDETDDGADEGNAKGGGSGNGGGTSTGGGSGNGGLGTGGGPPTAPPAPPTSTPTPTTTPRSGTFATEGGSLVVTCTGARVTVDAVTARDGWSFARVPGPRAGVVVEFRNEADSATVRIEVSCVGGRPERTGGGSTPGRPQSQDARTTSPERPVTGPASEAGTPPADR